MPSRILIIDDAPANIQTLSSILKERGYSINIATNGRQGLEVLERIRPDLILLDIMMPEMDGFETCQRIKASTTWREIPIVFLTAKTDTADIVRAFELGAVDYVAKPIIADRFDDVSVLFADIVGFTPLSARLSPTELIESLNRVFSGFDELADYHKLEKIKTIGDGYMVAGGLIEQNADHLAAMATMALAMHENVRELNGEFGDLSLRIGLQVGSVIAGVIGIRKFIYYVWGDTVNTASRLESQGAPGRTHVSETVFERLQGRFAFESRGTIELKGRGPMNTYFLGALTP